MTECKKCGEYTKFDGGLCYSCYKKDGAKQVVVVAEEKKVVAIARAGGKVYRE